MRSFCIQVEGQSACFTRPEMKVERVSYPVITPSAAVGIFSSILWKPAMLWHVNKIEVLKPIKFMQCRTNEVKDVISTESVSQVMRGGKKTLGINIRDGRTQRSGLILRDVSYRLHASIEFLKNLDPEASWHKYAEMFERRARKGQSFRPSFLGTRDHSCSWEFVEDPSKGPQPIPETRDLGRMLHSLDYNSPNHPPRTFHARIENGVVQVPLFGSAEVV